MRVLFLNKYTPPDPAPTSALIGDLAVFLRSKGFETSFVNAGEGYRTKPRTGWRRWWHDGMANLKMLLKGLLQPSTDVIVCLSDPPGCLVVGAILARLKGAKLVHWAMDVYPEIAVALGALRKDSVIYRTVDRLQKFAYDQCVMIACLDEDMAGVLDLKNDKRLLLCAPWPPRDLVLPEVIPTKLSEAKRLKWLYSGNLGRAHEYETLLLAQRQLEEEHVPFDLIFQGGGPARTSAMRLAEKLNLKHCQWLDYVPESQLISSLLEADVLIATQKKETQGLLWPSKLALMRLLSRPIVWVGPKEGAVSEMLRRLPETHGLFAPGEAVELAGWLKKRAGHTDSSSTNSYSSQRLESQLAAERTQAYQQWHDRLILLA